MYSISGVCLSSDSTENDAVEVVYKDYVYDIIFGLNLTHNIVIEIDSIQIKDEDGTSISMPGTHYANEGFLLNGRYLNVRCRSDGINVLIMCARSYWLIERTRWKLHSDIGKNLCISRPEWMLLLNSADERLSFCTARFHRRPVLDRMAGSTGGESNDRLDHLPVLNNLRNVLKTDRLCAIVRYKVASARTRPGQIRRPKPKASR